jgi:hypothetical protein
MRTKDYVGNADRSDRKADGLLCLAITAIMNLKRSHVFVQNLLCVAENIFIMERYRFLLIFTPSVVVHSDFF